jgi:hypothetical protein
VRARAPRVPRRRRWGSASDNERVYVNNNNYGHATLDFSGADAYLKPVPNEAGATSPPASANGGLLSALDAWDGKARLPFCTALAC